MGKKLVLTVVVAIAAMQFAGIRPRTVEQDLKQDLKQDLDSYSQMSARSMMGWGSERNWGG